ncbi:amino acid adenylation domain-containing protein, partial [Andreprevotia lacus DSM 23236]
QLERVGRNDNFFELGGHSLLAVSLIERMRQQQLHADVRDLFTADSLAELARHIDSAQAGAPVEVPPNLIPQDATHITPNMLTLVELTQDEIDTIIATVPGGAGNVQDIYPLAPLQEGILFHHMVVKQGDTYLLPNLYAFASRERLERFLASVQISIDRHDILRTALAWEGLSQPVQVVQRHTVLQPHWLSLDPAEGEIAAQLRELCNPATTRIDIRQAPLLACHIAEDAGHGRWLLHILAHHLAIDHTTLELLVEESEVIEQGRAADLPAPLPFRNFVAQARLGVSAQEHEAFFRNMLGGVDEPTAPFGLLDVQGDGHDVLEASLHLPGELSRAIRQQARSHGVSAASLLHLAWGLVLARTSGRNDVVFGTVLFGRMQGGEQADRVMGMFINTLPLCLSIGSDGVGSSLKAAHQQLARLLRHEHAPLALAQRCSGVHAPAPLFTSLLNYRHSSERTAADGEIAGITDLGGHERTNYPLTLAIDDLGEGFQLTAQVAQPIAPQRICAFMQAAVEQLVAALQQQPNQPLAQLDVLPGEERQQVLDVWNTTEQAYPQDVCLQQLIEAQVDATPDAIAVSQGEVQLSYAELNARANQLAHHLITLGVGPDRRVAVCVERSVELVIALLAVIKAGGAYVPLDPAYPGERLAFMLEDSAPTVILAKGDWTRVAAEAGVDVPVLDVAQADAPWLSASLDNPPRLGLGQHLAYVIYTSGSTGRPKAAQVLRQGMHNLLDWYIDDAGLRADDHILLLSSHSFDLTQKNIWGPLRVGGQLHLGVEPFLPEAILQQIKDEGITWLNMAPSAFHALVDTDASALQGLRTVVLGGEPIQTAKLKQIPAPRPRFINSYGPTECSDVVSWYVLNDNLDQYSQSVPLGRPVRHDRLYILNEQQQATPIGVVGEICVGGIGVGIGYFNQPELTAERFIPNPFSTNTDAKLYKTGDLGRWLADGTIEYLGRNDFQVKLRGFRIELGEIEAKLGTAQDIQEVAVLAREDSPGDKRLVAYYVGALDAEALRAHASAQLPAYMVPAAYVQLEFFPLTPNGKLDRKALPAPSGDAWVSRGYEAPVGQIEETLATLWADLLKVERVGRQDNFFELGGHSLLAVSLIERMRQAGLHAEVSTLLSSANLRELAAATKEIEEILL